ncbi:ABC transporter ATP-binding protein [Salipiger sp. PrR002]|uniref:ABC transporter ATP-binding protein n=1 Tax=Salipiger sp. PrR002 TaxID=2706489 RepID=UPI0013BE2F3F|nr:ABC transporter ATP-binding protein [Salipiger sp. PrR002]NDW00165.1 ABC transporter ATP-binding protein [Salipiger sp. PrR002]NDW56826.1 ABC transporter ATP-binding protein [Salipiger sp. PrR004]
MATLRATDIAVTFDSFHALRGVTLSVEAGRFVTLLGPSGCGKTTLLNVIAGFQTPTRGRVEIAGRDVTLRSPERRETAMCFQSYALFPHLDVAGNIAFGPRQKRHGRDATAARVADLIEQLGLTGHAEKLPNALSGGQQQRVALARALAVAPGIVLFDEPLSNLDAKLRDQVRAEIRALQREIGFTAVYVTHDQSEALALSDEVFLLNRGVVEQQGAPRDIYFNPRTRFAADFIGAANIHDGALRGGRMETPFGAIPAPGPDTENATICWRPEMAQAEGPLSGRVAAVAFQGGWTDVTVEEGGQSLRVQLPGHAQPTLGAPLHFGLRPEHITRLEAA